ncbi:MAG: hypothetical protein J0H06_08815 [Actinobacteria bacterium]|nr:hypothetical protein [Actinomycetota bacterium]
MATEGARAVIGWEPAPRPGWVAPHLEAEFPGLSLATVEVDGRPGRSPEPVRHRLRDLSDRLFGAEAIRLRGRKPPSWSRSSTSCSIGVRSRSGSRPIWR